MWQRDLTFSTHLVLSSGKYLAANFIIPLYLGTGYDGSLCADGELNQQWRADGKTEGVCGCLVPPPPRRYGSLV